MDILTPSCNCTREEKIPAYASTLQHGTSTISTRLGYARPQIASECKNSLQILSTEGRNPRILSTEGRNPRIQSRDADRSARVEFFQFYPVLSQKDSLTCHWRQVIGG
jgi:hypothetical protein